MQKYSNCTKWTINKVIIYHMNKTSHNELGKEAEQAYWDSFRPFSFFHSYGGGNSKRSASISKSNIWHILWNAWCLITPWFKNLLLVTQWTQPQKKKKDFALTKQALNSKWDEASKTLAW